jgi:hypothetical protein
MAYAPLVSALTEQGRLDEADRALAASGHAEEIPDTFMLNFVLFSRACLHRARGRTEQARADLEELAGRERKWRHESPGVFPWRSELALASTGEDDRERALVLAREELDLARPFGTAGAIGRAQRALGMVAGGDEGLQALRDSLDTLGGSPWRVGARPDARRAGCRHPPRGRPLGCPRAAARRHGARARLRSDPTGDARARGTRRHRRASCAPGSTRSPRARGGSRGWQLTA